MTAAHAAGAPPGRRLFLVDERTAYWLMVAPAALLMAAFYFYPLVQVLWISVTEPKPGLDNYAQLLTNGSIRRTVITTMRICVLTTVITIVLGYVVAYVLVHASPRAQRWLFLGVLVPLWISVLVRAFAWVTLLAREGLINTTLRDAGIIQEPLALIWNEFGIIVGMVHYMIPYAVLPLYANMRDIDARTISAARGLGGSRFYTFRRVFLPQSLPGIIGATVLVFIFSLGFFVTPAILGGGKTLMIAEFISLQILDLLRWGLGTMLASTLILFIFVLLAALAKVVDLKRLFGAG